jgi:hypothetical protein
MKKTLAMMAVAVVAVSATADLAYFQFSATALTDQGASLSWGPITDGAVVQLVDLSSFVSDGKIDIANIPTAWSIGDIGVTPFGGSSDTFSERDASLIGQTAYLVFDANGGGIEVGDFIALSAGFEITDMAAASDPAPSNPQTMSVGALDATIEVIPEPATFGLMGVAGLGMFLARRKARR